MQDKKERDDRLFCPFFDGWILLDFCLLKQRCQIVYYRVLLLDARKALHSRVRLCFDPRLDFIMPSNEHA
jgi:hypothetical protein